MYNCKFCFNDDIRENFISPCLCSGNIKYVHRECLNNWRLINSNNQNYHACEICKNKFILETENNFGILTKIIFITKILFFNFFLFSSIFLIGKLVNLLSGKSITIVNNTYVNDFLFGLTILSILSAFVLYIVLCHNHNFAQFQERNIIYSFNNNLFLLSATIVGLIIIIYYIIKLQILFIKKYNFYFRHKYRVKDLDK